MKATKLPAYRAARVTRRRDALRSTRYGLSYSCEWAQAGVRAGGAQHARALEKEQLVTRQTLGSKRVPVFAMPLPAQTWTNVRKSLRPIALDCICVVVKAVGAEPVIWLSVLSQLFSPPRWFLTAAILRKLPLLYLVLSWHIGRPSETDEW